MKSIIISLFIVAIYVGSYLYINSTQHLSGQFEQSVRNHPSVNSYITESQSVLLNLRSFKNVNDLTTYINNLNGDSLQNENYIFGTKFRYRFNNLTFLIDSLGSIDSVIISNVNSFNDKDSSFQVVPLVLSNFFGISSDHNFPFLGLFLFWFLLVLLFVICIIIAIIFYLKKKNATYLFASIKFLLGLLTLNFFHLSLNYLYLLNSQFQYTGTQIDGDLYSYKLIFKIFAQLTQNNSFVFDVSIVCLFILGVLSYLLFKSKPAL